MTLADVFLPSLTSIAFVCLHVVRALLIVLLIQFFIGYADPLFAIALSYLDWHSRKAIRIYNQLWRADLVDRIVREVTEAHQDIRLNETRRGRPGLLPEELRAILNERH
jgi:hypothetical protein